MHFFLGALRVNLRLSGFVNSADPDLADQDPHCFHCTCKIRLITGTLQGILIKLLRSVGRIFAWFDSLHHSQQCFSQVGTGLPGLNQYKAKDKVSCSRTQHISSGEGRTL